VRNIMSKAIVQEIILKAQKEPNFMKTLLADPQTALKSYQLTSQEIEFFQSADETTLRGLSPACFQLAEGRAKKQSSK